MMEAVKISLICYIFVALGEPGMIFAWYQKLINRLPEWLAKPLGACGYCITGQVSFWYYLFTTPHYNVIDHLFFSSLSIFLISIYSFIWNLE